MTSSRSRTCWTPGSPAPVTVLRLPMVYGPGDPQRRVAGVVERPPRRRAARSDGRGRLGAPRARGGRRLSCEHWEGWTARGGDTYNLGEPDAGGEREWILAVASSAPRRGKWSPIRKPSPVWGRTGSSSWSPAPVASRMSWATAEPVGPIEGLGQPRALRKVGSELQSRLAGQALASPRAARSSTFDPAGREARSAAGATRSSRGGQHEAPSEQDRAGARGGSRGRQPCWAWLVRRADLGPLWPAPDGGSHRRSADRCLHPTRKSGSGTRPWSPRPRTSPGRRCGTYNYRDLRPGARHLPRPGAADAGPAERAAGRRAAFSSGRPWQATAGGGAGEEARVRRGGAAVGGERRLHSPVPEEFLTFEAPTKGSCLGAAGRAGHGERSVFSTETRVATTDAEARRKFRRYWSLMSPDLMRSGGEPAPGPPGGRAPGTSA